MEKAQYMTKEEVIEKARKLGCSDNKIELLTLFYDNAIEKGTPIDWESFEWRKYLPLSEQMRIEIYKISDFSFDKFPWLKKRNKFIKRKYMICQKTQTK